MKILKFVGLIFLLSLWAKIFMWTVSYMTNPPSQGIQRAGELIAEASVPWWLPVLVALASIGGILGAGLVVVFLLRLIAEDAA